MRVYLSKPDVEHVVRVAYQRQRFAEGAGLRSGDRAHSEIDCHVIGAMGEMAVSRLLGVTWRPNVGELHRPDIEAGGHPVEVRTRVLGGTGEDLAFIAKDKPNVGSIFVLAHVRYQSPRCLAHMVDVIGWCYGREGMRRRYWRDLARYRPHGVCFVPRRDLHTVEELLEMTREASHQRGA